MSTSLSFTARLDDIAQLNPRLSIEVPEDEVVSFLPMSAVDSNQIDARESEVRRYGNVKKSYTHFLNGDILVAKITPCFENGKIAQARPAHRHGFGSTEFHVVRPDPSRLDARYLVHYLRQPRIRLEGTRRMTGSAGQRRVPVSFLSELSVPLPSLSDQRRIAEILDKADALRAKRRAAIAELDALTQSIFLDMFGDPFTNPKGWPRVAMPEAVMGKYGIKAGPFGSSIKKSDYAVAGYRVYGQEQVIAGRFDVGDYYVGERKYQQLKACAVSEGDVLVSLVGSFGKVLIVPRNIEPGIINPRLLKITPDRRLLTPLFLATFLRLRTTQAAFERMSHGGTMGILNARLLKQLNIALPPMTLQEQFGDRAAAVDLLTSNHRASLVDLDAVFISLQYRAFRGEL